MYGVLRSAGLMSSGAARRMTSDFIAERAAKQKLETKRQEAAKEAARQEAAKLAADNPMMQSLVSENAGMEKSAEANGAGAKPAEAKTTPPQQQPETPMVENFFREAKAHYDGAVRPEIGFAELRMVLVKPFLHQRRRYRQAGAYEREAIRPHVLGKFVDLLIAAESHSAMLNYLGNSASMGPNSVTGINRDRGINENLGREILELHTLGVRRAGGGRLAGRQGDRPLREARSQGHHRSARCAQGLVARSPARRRARVNRRHLPG
jgi:uncharacterized protein (DUF1800 family)